MNITMRQERTHMAQAIVSLQDLERQIDQIWAFQ